MQKFTGNSLAGQICSFLACVVLSGFVGCGGGGAGLAEETLIPVTGVVTLDGAPLEGAELVFEPQGAGGISIATTNEKGNTP